MNTPHHIELLAEIEAYSARFGLSKSAFGKIVMKDPNFVFSLENGRDLRMSTVERVKQAMLTPPAEAAE